MAAQKAEEEHRLDALREDGSKSRKNARSAPYDPITLEYDQSDAGQELRNKDESSVVRALVRAKHLQVKSRGADYDLLTGDDRPAHGMPRMANVPDRIVRRAEEQSRALYGDHR